MDNKQEAAYAIVINEHWTCGDGCCSDSWYYYEVFDKDGEMLESSPNDSSSAFMYRHSIEEHLREHYGDIPIRSQRAEEVKKDGEYSIERFDDY